MRTRLRKWRVREQRQRWENDLWKAVGAVHSFVYWSLDNDTETVRAIKKLVRLVGKSKEMPPETKKLIIRKTGAMLQELRSESPANKVGKIATEILQKAYYKR